MTARVWHNAKTAVLVASFHDGDVHRRPAYVRRRKVIKFFDFGKANVNDGDSRLPKLINHAGEPVQRLRAKYDIDKRSPSGDCSALLTCHTSTNTDDDVWAFDFKAPPPTQLMEYFLLSFLPYSAGVQENDVRFLFSPNKRRVMSISEQVRYSRRVVLIHLAALGF